MGIGRAPGELDHRAIDGKTRVGVEDVGARLAEHQYRGEHRYLAARHDDHLVRRNLHAHPPVYIGRHRLTERLDARCRRVAVLPIAQRLHRRFDDVVRRAEIGLADAEIDDVLALTHEFGRAGKHGEGILFADPAEAGDGIKQRGSSGAGLG